VNEDEWPDLSVDAKESAKAGGIQLGRIGRRQGQQERGTRTVEDPSIHGPLPRTVQFLGGGHQDLVALQSMRDTFAARLFGFFNFSVRHNPSTEGDPANWEMQILRAISSHCDRQYPVKQAGKGLEALSRAVRSA
jgi:hypothetical protein